MNKYVSIISYQMNGCSTLKVSYINFVFLIVMFPASCHWWINISACSCSSIELCHAICLYTNWNCRLVIQIVWYNTCCKHFSIHLHYSYVIIEQQDVLVTYFSKCQQINAYCCYQFSSCHTLELSVLETEHMQVFNHKTIPEWMDAVHCQIKSLIY